MSNAVVVREAHEMVTAKFYHYRQNNSGGGFDYDEDQGISVNVYVQAFTADEANSIAEGFGLYFGGGGDCSCCGDRWYPASEHDGEYSPPDAAGQIGLLKWIDGYETFVHYLDGQVVGMHK